MWGTNDRVATTIGRLSLYNCCSHIQFSARIAILFSKIFLFFIFYNFFFHIDVFTLHTIIYVNYHHHNYIIINERLKSKCTITKKHNYEIISITMITKICLRICWSYGCISLVSRQKIPAWQFIISRSWYLEIILHVIDIAIYYFLLFLHI